MTSETNFPVGLSKIIRFLNMIDCGSGDKNDKLIYAVAMAQFLLGVLITVINTLLVAVLITTEKLKKDATHFLLANMWFANLLLGVIIAVVNVVEHGGNVVSIEKPKGTITIINSMVTLVLLLTLITNRLLIVRANKQAMSLKCASIVVAVTWSSVFVLTFVKAIVSSLNKYNGSTCWICFLNFEVAILILLGIVAVFFFIITLVKHIVRKKHTVTEGASEQSDWHQAVVNTQKNEMRITVTVGMLLIVFLVVMASYILMQAVWLYQNICVDASEIIICIFYFHCLLNPAIYLCRDKEARQALRRLITCKSGKDDIQQNQELIESKPIHRENQPMNNAEHSTSYHQQPNFPPIEEKHHLPPLRLETAKPERIETTARQERIESANRARIESAKPAQDMHVQSMSEFRKPSAPLPPEDPDRRSMKISHIETAPPGQLPEHNIGFVENGELTGGGHI